LCRVITLIRTVGDGELLVDTGGSLEYQSAIRPHPGVAIAVGESSMGRTSTTGGGDHKFGVCASIAAIWLYEQLEHRLPRALRTELTDVKAMLVGLATGSSLDTVIVSRSRKAITERR
jgi:hypothetical protein